MIQYYGTRHLQVVFVHLHEVHVPMRFKIWLVWLPSWHTTRFGITYPVIILVKSVVGFKIKNKTVQFFPL